jgi:hypothetical protein
VLVKSSQASGPAVSPIQQKGLADRTSFSPSLAAILTTQTVALFQRVVVFFGEVAAFFAIVDQAAIGTRAKQTIRQRTLLVGVLFHIEIVVFAVAWARTFFATGVAIFRWEPRNLVLAAVVGDQGRALAGVVSAAMLMASNKDFIGLLQVGPERAPEVISVAPNLKFYIGKPSQSLSRAERGGWR